MIYFYLTWMEFGSHIHSMWFLFGRIDFFSLYHSISEPVYSFTGSRVFRTQRNALFF